MEMPRQEGSLGSPGPHQANRDSGKVVAKKTTPSPKARRKVPAGKGATLRVAGCRCGRVNGKKNAAGPGWNLKGAEGKWRSNPSLCALVRRQLGTRPESARTPGVMSDEYQDLLAQACCCTGCTVCTDCSGRPNSSIWPRSLLSLIATTLLLLLTDLTTLIQLYSLFFPPSPPFPSSCNPLQPAPNFHPTVSLRPA